MPAALRRLSLESAVLGALPFTIVAVASSSNWSPGLRSVAEPFRAAGLVAFCALALAGSARARSSLRTLPASWLAAAGFLAVAAVSVAWSVAPRQTIARGGAFGLLIVGAASVGAWVAGEPRMARRVLLALLVGAAMVGLIGLGIYAVSPDNALQPATGQVGARFRGLGQNPNTVAMFFALVLPLAILVAIEARSARARLAAAVTFLLLAGSIGASGSRGALLAACVGLLVFGLSVAGDPARRAAVVVAVGVLGLALAAIGSLPEPLSPAEAAKLGSPSANTQKYTPNDAQYRIRLEDELGYEGGYHSRSSDLLSGSGRIDAWRGALRQGDGRPVAGYGFGAEEAVFVDRFQDFQGGVPENSFIGLFLQLGLAGVLLFLMLLGALAVAAVRALRIDRTLAAACLGVLAAGVALACVQSFVYAVGNVATLTLWVVAFMPASRTT